MSDQAPQHLHLKETSDGSHTLYNSVLNEHYHSHHGALQESRHVFIQAGFSKVFTAGNTIRILEIGFGTGLNALLTLMESVRLSCPVVYTALEPFPLSAGIIRSLNYTSLPGLSDYTSVFQQMHSLAEGKQQINAYFLLERSLHPLDQFSPSGMYDLVYFDAFAPEVQPELWTEAVFQKLYDCLAPGGILVTYCAKGEVKRNMKKAGFLIERLPGPPGKREMTRAMKN
jgi:tRNA U34 5-methylaminomethyl-2-thiouridine-forming methyltransferase MnmC